MAIGSTIRVYCGECKRPTNHVVIAERSVDPHPMEVEKWGENHYFCQCAGCDSYAYAISEWDEGDWNPHVGEMDLRWRTYPSQKLNVRPSMKITCCHRRFDRFIAKLLEQ